MPRHLVSLFLCIFGIFSTILLPSSVEASLPMPKNKNREKSAVFLSPKIELGAGSVSNKFYYNVDFPKGHIAIKEFDAELVDEFGNPVPLHETYLHHWIILRYYMPKQIRNDEENGSNITVVRNSGVCTSLSQYYGLGSETRRTKTYVPDPYGVEVGDPTLVPHGQEQRWMFNIHAIDTRGVVDRLGCTECRCDLYNVTKGEDGEPLPPGYSGGLDCCFDKTQCRLRKGFKSIKRNLYLRYTVKWVDWEPTIVPVKIYIFDITDTGKRGNVSEQPCKVEYDVEACSRKAGVKRYGCIENKRTSVVMPNGGYVIYGVAHQHSGGRGSTLYGKDGRVICSSIPVYGKGKEAGNEAGYIVGMSTCYPRPGSVKVSKGETLVLESNYSSTQKHTGVMGLFYILVADRLSPKPVH